MAKTPLEKKIEATAAAAAAAEAEIPTTPYIVLTRRIWHNKKQYVKGDTIHLSIQDATNLLGSDSVLPLKPDTTVEEVNAAIDLRKLSREQLAAHAVDTYKLNVHAEATVEDLITAIDAARAAGTTS